MNTLTIAALTAVLACAGCSTAGQDSAVPTASTESTEAQPGTLASRDASMTIVPVLLAGRPSEQVAQVVGMMLERGGMTRLALSPAAFTPPEGASLDATAEAFGAFVGRHPIDTEYALYAEFRGTPGTGCDEVRTVIVTARGDVAWKEAQDDADALFRRIRPSEPMQCCLLVAEELRPLFALDDPMRADAPAGRLAKEWRQETGIPSNAEMQAIASRARQFADAPASTTLLVYPPHVTLAGDRPAASARALAELIDGARLVDAIPSDSAPSVTVKGDMNEQKVLWETARQFAAFVAAHPPEADYALYADYLMGRTPEGALSVGAVHTIVCDRTGALVVVDFQNGHGADFKAVAPSTVAGCDRLVVRRLESIRRGG